MKNNLYFIIGVFTSVFLISAILLFFSNSTPIDNSKSPNILESKSFKVIPSLGNKTNRFNYTIDKELDLESILKNKSVYFYTNNPDKIILDNVFKNKEIVSILEKDKGKIELANGYYNIVFNYTPEGSVLGFNNEELNLKKLLEYLTKIGIKIETSNLSYTSSYILNNSDEYVTTTKDKGELQVIDIANGINNDKIYLDDNDNILSASFDRLNRITKISFLVKEINIPVLEKVEFTFNEDYLKLLTSTGVIDNNGLFDYYLSNPLKNREMKSARLIFASTSDNYLIPFLEYFDLETKSTIRLPLISADKISY